MRDKNVSWDADGGELHLRKSEISEELWDDLMMNANGRHLHVFCVDDTKSAEIERACGLLDDISGTCNGCKTLFKSIKNRPVFKDNIYEALKFIDKTCHQLRLIASSLAEENKNGPSE